jgi:hypothetical protein
MAGSFSDFLEKEIQDHIFGNAAYSPPATMYIRLFTIAPSDTGGGTEANYDGYVQYGVAYANNATNWPAATGVAATKKQAVAITYATNTGTSTDTIVAMGIYDGNTISSNLLQWADLASSKAIGPSDIPKFNANAISGTLD